MRNGRVGPVLALGLLPLLSGPCEDGSTFEGRRLPGSVSSLEQLASEVLAGLAAADTSRLDALRLTEREHNEIVWPELPAARPEANFPVDIAWMNISNRNRVALRRLFAVYGGHSLHLVGVECRGETQEFESFEVHTDCRVTLLRDRVRLPPQRIFKDVLDRDGELKIFRYYAP